MEAPPPYSTFNRMEHSIYVEGAKPRGDGRPKELNWYSQMMNHNYTYRYTPTYLELNCQWIFELAKIVISLMLITFLAVSGFANWEPIAEIQGNSALFKPAGIYEYVVVIIVLVMAIAIPVFYFTRADIFLGTTNWQRTLLIYNLFMAVVTLPAFIMAAVLAGQIERCKEMVKTSSGACRVKGHSQLYRKYSSSGRIGLKPQTSAADFYAVMVANAVLLSLLLLVFIIHVFMIPCVKEKIFRKPRTTKTSPRRGNDESERSPRRPQLDDDYFDDDLSGSLAPPHARDEYDHEQRRDKNKSPPKSPKRETSPVASLRRHQKKQRYQSNSQPRKKLPPTHRRLMDVQYRSAPALDNSTAAGSDYMDRGIDDADSNYFTNSYARSYASSPNRRDRDRRREDRRPLTETEFSSDYDELCDSRDTIDTFDVEVNLPHHREPREHDRRR